MIDQKTKNTVEGLLILALFAMIVVICFYAYQTEMDYNECVVELNELKQPSEYSYPIQDNTGSGEFNPLLKVGDGYNACN